MVGATIGGAIDRFQGPGIGAGADVQICQKTKAGLSGTRHTQIETTQGVGGQIQQGFDETVNEKRYRTRVMSTANQVNLDYDEAAPQFDASLTRILAGLF